MRSLNIPTVAGNHDLLVAGAFSDHPHQLDRMQASAYNAGLLSTLPDAIEYLANLPLSLEGADWVAVHHSPFHVPSPGVSPSIENFSYLDKKVLDECVMHWQEYPKRLIFSGHDHVPAVYELSPGGVHGGTGSVFVHRPSNALTMRVQIKEDSRYWIKAGSVGGPYRDGVAVANGVLYDSDEQTLTLFRAPYSTERLRSELREHPYCRNLETLKKYVDLLEQWSLTNA
jgi:hypothetical protein